MVRSLWQEPEFPGGIAARIELRGGWWVYVQALPTGHPRAGDYYAEALTSDKLGGRGPIPELLSVVDGAWLALAYTDVAGTRPRLRPGSADITAVFTALGSLARTMTPCPLPDVPAALDRLDARLSGWRGIRAQPPPGLDDWSARYVEDLAALETSWQPWAGGDTLLHGELSPANLVLAGRGKVLVTGWRYPMRGAAWLDLLSLVPYLLAAGHEPRSVDRLLRRRSALAGVPAWAVTAFGVALAGAATLRECGAERERGIALAEPLRQWVAHRTRWS